MPLYEYACQTCEVRSEDFRAMDARNEPARCDCGGELNRLLSNPAVHFNGPGFTRTPSIMRDPIAAQSSMRGTNWGTTGSELGARAMEDD